MSHKELRDDYEMDQAEFEQMMEEIEEEQRLQEEYGDHYFIPDPWE